MHNLTNLEPQNGATGEAMPHIDRCCDNCLYWSERAEYTGRYLPNGKREMAEDGDCRIRPPRFTGTDQVGRWPRTNASDWCARWAWRGQDD